MLAPRAGGREDSGQTMVLVMLVTTLCLVFVGTSVSLSASNIGPASRTGDTMAALAAAQAGVEEFTLAVESCEAAVVGCAAISDRVVRIVGADGATRAAYEWDVIATPDDNAAEVLRVEVTGSVGNPGREIDRTLVADYETVETVFDYAYFTDVETASPRDITTYYGGRTVSLPSNPTRDKADLLPSPRPSLVTWQGAENAGIGTTCERTWMDTGSVPGRAQLRETNALPEGVDYVERTTTPSGSGAVSRPGACEVPFGTGFVTGGTAQIYSKDALYLSRLVAGGAGPRFGAATRTEWGPESVPAPGTPGTWYRSDAVWGGALATGSVEPSLSTSPLALPSSASNVESNPATTCVFTGPSRIKLAGAFAYVTSPGTPTLAPAGRCTGVKDTTLSGTGLLNVKIPITASTVFYVKNGTAGPPAGAASPLLKVQKVMTTPAVAAEPALFYKDMETTEAVLKAKVVAEPLKPLDQALGPWLAQLNAAQDGKKEPRYLTTGAPAALTPTAIDGLYEASATSIMVQRSVCQAFVRNQYCKKWKPATDAFTVTREAHTFPLATDVTRYTTGVGNAFVEGTVTGNLTIIAANDVVVTEDIIYGATSTPTMLGLVAQGNGALGGDVEIYRPVSCSLPPSPSSPLVVGAPCPNDITGLYSSPMLSKDPAHPSMQYGNLQAGTRSSLLLQAAILTPAGALTVQNPMRGTDNGVLAVDGAVYQQHRGMLGLYNGTSVLNPNRGYTLTMNYDSDLQDRQPPLFSDLRVDPNASTWTLLGVAERQDG